MRSTIKKWFAGTLALGVCTLALAGCGSPAESQGPEGAGTAAQSEPIVVISREDGSGTRGAFTELFGLEEKQGDSKVDLTTPNAQTTNSTGIMMTTVAGNKNAIGYISLGSLDDSVKALKVDKVEATTENIKNGSYKIARPFNVATMGEVKPVAKDFLNFIASAEGQQIIAAEKYIGVNDGASNFGGTSPEGKIVIAGSSSVSPLIEALKEAYVALNPKADIEIQTSDSTTGMNSVADGICDIGMASRQVKDSELEKGLIPTVIAQDGIAVVVNKDRDIDQVNSETVTGIYKGEITTWDQVTAG